MSGGVPSIFMPELEQLTEHERAWIGFLRLITNDTDPAPTLARVQALRQAVTGDGRTGTIPP